MMKQKKIVSMVGVLVLFLCNASFVFAEAKGIAVAQIEYSHNTITSEEADIIRDLYIAELTKVAGLNVVDRNHFDKIFDELEFQMSDWSNSNKTIELGNATNASFIALGKVSKLGSKVFFQYKIMDVANGNILLTGKRFVSSVDGIADALSDITNDISKQISLRLYSFGEQGPGGGDVFYIDGDTCYECLCLAPPGQYNNEKMKAAAESFRGGGFTDWRLATSEEMVLIYKNVFCGTDDKGHKIVKNPSLVGTYLFDKAEVTDFDTASALYFYYLSDGNGVNPKAFERDNWYYYEFLSEGGIPTLFYRDGVSCKSDRRFFYVRSFKNEK